MWLKIAPAKIRLVSAGNKSGERIPPKEEDKTKIHELIVGEHLSKQWGEPQRF